MIYPCVILIISNPHVLRNRSKFTRKGAQLYGVGVSISRNNWIIFCSLLINNWDINVSPSAAVHPLLHQSNPKTLPKTQRTKSQHIARIEEKRWSISKGQICPIAQNRPRAGSNKNIVKKWVADISGNMEKFPKWNRGEKIKKITNHPIFHQFEQFEENFGIYEGKWEDFFRGVW